MVGRRNTLLVTKRSLRNSDSSAGKRPRRAVQNKLLDDTVGLSRKEEQELNKALYASLHETRRTKSVPSLCGHSRSTSVNGNSHGASPSTRGSISASNITRASNLKSLGHRRSLRTTSVSPKRLVKKNPSIAKLKKSESLTPSRSTFSHSLSRSAPAASISIDESSQDSVRSSCSSVNGSKRKIHAQRKFAQGCSLPGTPSCTPIKSSTPPVKMISSRIPKTEDFLTFLCLRGSSILPPHLDIFNYSREAMPSQEEGPRSSAASSAKIKCRRESTPDSSSTSSGANEEVAEAAAVSTPSSTGRSSGSSLLAKRSAARASAGTPETARGIVSLRQGLQRKVSTSSSSSSSARFPVSSSPSRLVSGLTNTPQSWYRTKFYFTPEKSPSPSKASGIRPGEFTPPSLFSSARPESYYFGSTHNFSPLVCPPSSSKFASNTSPSGSLASRASSSSSSSSLSSSYAGGASKRKRRRSLPSSDATSQVKLMCATASVPSFGVNKCSRLASQDCLATSLPSCQHSSSHSLSKTLSSSLPNLSVSTASPTSRSSCLQILQSPSTPLSNKSLPLSFKDVYVLSDNSFNNSESASQTHTNHTENTRDVTKPCLNSPKFIKNISEKCVEGSCGTASNANVHCKHNSSRVFGVKKDTKPVKSSSNNTSCKTCHAVENLRSLAANSHCGCFKHENCNVQLGSAKIDSRVGSMGCRRNCSGHQLITNCDCGYSNKTQTFLHDHSITCQESQHDCCDTNQFVHDCPSSSQQCLHDCSFGNQPYLHYSSLPKYNIACMHTNPHLPTNSTSIKYPCYNSCVGLHSHGRGKNYLSWRARHSDSCVPYTAHGSDSDIDNIEDHSSLCACELCLFAGRDNSSPMEDEVFFISDDSNNSCDIKSVLFEGSDGELHEGYTAQGHVMDNSENVGQAHASAAQDGKGIICGSQDDAEPYDESNVNDNISFSVITEAEELCETSKQEQRSDTESLKKCKRSERKRKKRHHSSGTKKRRRRDRFNQKRGRVRKKYHLVKEVPKLKIRIVRKQSSHNTVESGEDKWRPNLIKKPSHEDFQMEFLKMLRAGGIACSPIKVPPMGSRLQHVEERQSRSSTVLCLSDSCDSNEEGCSNIPANTERAHSIHPESAKMQTENELCDEDFSECDKSIICCTGEENTDVLDKKEIKMVDLPTLENRTFSDSIDIIASHSQNINPGTELEIKAHASKTKPLMQKEPENNFSKRACVTQQINEKGLHQHSWDSGAKSVIGSSQLADSLILRDKVISAFAKFNRKETIVSSIEVTRSSEQRKDSEGGNVKEVRSIDVLKNNSEGTEVIPKIINGNEMACATEGKEKNVAGDGNFSNNSLVQDGEMVEGDKKETSECTVEQAGPSQDSSSPSSLTLNTLSKYVQTENTDDVKDLRDEEKTNVESLPAVCESLKEMGCQTALNETLVTGQEKQTQANLCTNTDPNFKPRNSLLLSENNELESKSTSTDHFIVEKADNNNKTEVKKMVSATGSANCNERAISEEDCRKYFCSTEKNYDKETSCFDLSSSKLKGVVGLVSSSCQTEGSIEIKDSIEDHMKPAEIIVVDDSSEENEVPVNSCHGIKKMPRTSSSGKRNIYATHSSCAVNPLRGCCNDTLHVALDLAKKDLPSASSRSNKVVQTEFDIEINTHQRELTEEETARSQNVCIHNELAPELNRNQICENPTINTEYSRPPAAAYGRALVNPSVAHGYERYNRQSFSYVCCDNISHPEISNVSSNVASCTGDEKTTALADALIEIRKSHSKSGTKKTEVSDKEIIILDDCDKIMNFYQNSDTDKQDVLSAEIQNFNDFVIDLSVTRRSNSASSSSSESFSASSCDCSCSSSASSLDQLEIYESRSQETCGSNSAVNVTSVVSSRCDLSEKLKVEKGPNFPKSQSYSKEGMDLRLESRKKFVGNKNQQSEMSSQGSPSNIGHSQSFASNAQSKSAGHQDKASDSIENLWNNGLSSSNCRLNVSTGSLFRTTRTSQSSPSKHEQYLNFERACKRYGNSKIGNRKQYQLKDIAVNETARHSSSKQCDNLSRNRSKTGISRNQVNNSRKEHGKKGLLTNEVTGIKGKRKGIGFPSFPKSQRERSFSDGHNQGPGAIMLHSYGSLNTGKGFALINGQLQQCEILDKNQLMEDGMNRSASLPSTSRDFSSLAVSKLPAGLKSQLYRDEKKNPTSYTGRQRSSENCDTHCEVRENSFFSSVAGSIFHDDGKPACDSQTSQDLHSNSSIHPCHKAQDRLCLQESIYLRHDISDNSSSGFVPLHKQKHLQYNAESSILSRQFENFRFSKHESSRLASPLQSDTQRHQKSRKDFSQFVIKPKKDLGIKKDVTSSKKALVPNSSGKRSSNKSFIYSCNARNSISHDHFAQLPERTSAISKGKRTSKTKSEAVSTLKTKQHIPNDRSNVNSSRNISDKSVLRDTYDSKNEVSLCNQPSKKHLNESAFGSHQKATHKQQNLQNNDNGGFSEYEGLNSGSLDCNSLCTASGSIDFIADVDNNEEGPNSLSAQVGECSSKFQKNSRNDFNSKQARKCNEKPKTDFDIVNDPVDLSWNISQSPTLSISSQCVVATNSTSPIDRTPVLPLGQSKLYTPELLSSSGKSSCSVFPISLHSSYGITKTETDKRVSNSEHLESNLSSSSIPGPLNTGNQDENVLDVIMEELKVQIALLKSEITKENQFRFVEKFTALKEKETCPKDVLPNSSLGLVPKISPPSSHCHCHSYEYNDIKKVENINVESEDKKEIKPKSESGTGNSLLQGGKGEVFEVIWTYGNPHFSPNKNIKDAQSSQPTSKQVPVADDVEFLQYNSLEECIEISSDNEED